MKYSSQSRQLSLNIFGTSLEKLLNPNNRWYKLAQSLPWAEIEREYNKTLGNKRFGAGNKPARLIIGTLIIKHKMNLSEEETIQIIRENPYMQCFIDMEEFSDKEVFDSSLFVTLFSFRNMLQFLFVLNRRHAIFLLKYSTEIFGIVYSHRRCNGRYIILVLLNKFDSIFQS